MDKITANGWISPDGEIYPCELLGHRDKAEEIGLLKGFTVDNIFYYTSMWERGYICFSGNPNSAKPVISFDSCTGNGIDPTEAQKMAQARIVKQFYQPEDYNEMHLHK